MYHSHATDHMKTFVEKRIGHGGDYGSWKTTRNRWLGHSQATAAGTQPDYGDWDTARLRRLGYVHKMANNRILRQALTWFPEIGRENVEDQGRPAEC